MDVNLEGVTGEELRDRVMNHGRWQRGGVKCPICDGHAAVNVYRPDYFMAAGLLLYFVYRPKDGRFATMMELSRDHEGLLRWWRDGLRTFRRWHFWGLIEQESQFDPDGDNTRWRISREGIQFVLGNLQIPQDVIVYKKQLIGDTLAADDPGETITIDDLLVKGVPSQDKFRVDVPSLFASCGQRQTASPIPVYRKCEHPVAVPAKAPVIDYTKNPGLVAVQLAHFSRSPMQRMRDEQ